MSCSGFVGGFSNDDCTAQGVQDKVCINAQRTITAGDGNEEQIYISNTIIDATGFFKILSTSFVGTANYTLVFYLNGVELNTGIIDPILVNETIAFTMVNFDEIKVRADQTSTITYELSLTPRYAL
jgi:predicted extracellular nuclease